MLFSVRIGKPLRKFHLSGGKIRFLSEENENSASQNHRDPHGADWRCFCRRRRPAFRNTDSEAVLLLIFGRDGFCEFRFRFCFGFLLLCFLLPPVNLNDHDNRHGDEQNERCYEKE